MARLLVFAALVFCVNDILKEVSASPVNNNVFTFSQSKTSKNKTKNVHPNTEHSDKTCGYQSCKLGKPGMINVHLVAHTHDDVGWLKTVDQYYYGAHKEITPAGVQYILDEVIDELQKDPNKKFIYVEVAFFYRWWNEQHDSVRHLVQQLVREGRLEFILGGWCMNDEASTHYNAIIDQHTVGFRFLKRNFGDCGIPKIGWQIDPFGHSREQASLFAQFGFDGLFFGRLDYEDKETRLKSKTMEMMWMGSANLGQQSFLFTGATFNGYGPPAGFCFDQRCKDDPIMDDPKLDGYNVDVKVKEFIDAVNKQAGHYSTSHIMMTMGSDFEYENAHENFKLLDKLIEYVNLQQKNGSNINLLYSSPSCYLYALNQVNQTYTTKGDDFFPYAHRPHSFWTGYFTSRPTLKGYVRNTNNFLQVCKQLDVLSNLGPEFGSALKIDILRQAMGVAQHHDAVSGTEKQAVAFDYAKRLAKGIAACQDVVNFAYNKIMPKSGQKSAPLQQFCPLLNVSVCPTTEHNNKFTVTLYNPVGREVEYWTNVPVSGQAYTVLDSELSPVKSELIPISPVTKHIPAHNGSIATSTLVFKAILPALGYRTYFISARADSDAEVVEPLKQYGPYDFKIQNKFVSLGFSSDTGLLESISTASSPPVSLQQNLFYYKSFYGSNMEPQDQASGAYVFRPNGSTPIPVSEGNAVKTTIIKGQNVQEVHQVFSDWASQVVRLYDGAKFVEFEWTVGPIPINDNQGKEIISKFTTNIVNSGTFFTDSNGREVLKRVKDYRPTWKLNQTEPVSGNYYPVNSRIYIQDVKSDLQLTVLTDRSQGGASINDGEVELMVHRRTLADDALGVGEPLNETGISGKGLVVRGKHYLFLSSKEEAGPLHRDFGERLFMAPSVSFAALAGSPSDYTKHYNTKWTGLTRSLPPNVHLLTLEEWEANSFLLRLEHFYEKSEDKVLSQPATVQLKDLFHPLTIKSVKELTLGANMLLSEGHRLQWNVKDHGYTKRDMSSFVKPLSDDWEVTLKPMQIRTFQVFF